MSRAIAEEPLLVTGASGFLGRHLMAAVRAAGQPALALGRGPAGVGRISADLTAGPPDLPRVGRVWHAAGLAHRLPRNRAEEQRFFDVNAGGTEHLLRALERQARPPRHLVLISTVAVYGREEGPELDESEPLAASDAYGRSKLEAERLALAWSERQAVPLTVLRLPLVAGIGAPGNWGAMVRHLGRGSYRGIGAGASRRSLVLAGEDARLMAALVPARGTFHLTDGCHPSFLELETALARVLGRPAPPRLPLWLAQALARCGDLGGRVLRRPLPFDSHTYEKMTRSLTFSDALARRELAWRPGSVLDFLAALEPGTAALN